MTGAKQPEPWLRGTLNDLPAVARAVLHALQLADEDLTRWCSALNLLQLNAQPGGLAPVAFQIRHIARSIDRLLTYAEGRQLGEAQMAALRTEMDAGKDDPFEELRVAIRQGSARIRALSAADLEMARVVGRREFPTTLGGLL